PEPIEKLCLVMRVVGGLGLLVSLAGTALSFMFSAVAQLLPLPALIGGLVLSALLLLGGSLPLIIRGAGVLGLINTLLCDAIKALTKEDFVPEGTSNFMHCLAPFMAVLPIFVA